MIAEVTIDIDEAFDSLGNDESTECVSNFYAALPHRHQHEIIAQIIEDADDDDELAHPNVLQVLAMVLFVILSFNVWLIRLASRSQRNNNEKGGSEQ